jgi:hypothetical protein
MGAPDISPEVQFHAFPVLFLMRSGDQPWCGDKYAPGTRSTLLESLISSLLKRVLQSVAGGCRIAIV